MFGPVLVGIDGREGGRDALALARRLAPDGALTLATVFPMASRPWRGANPELAAAQRREATRRLVRERDAARLQAELRVVCDSSPGRGLGRLAEALGADLLVVGSTRRGLIGRVCLSHDTQAALGGAPCALAVAPVGYHTREQPVERIGIGFDGQPESRHALTVACHVANQHGARVSALQIVRIPAVLAGGGPAPMTFPIEDMVSEGYAPLHRLGDLDARAVYGQASQELSRFSRELDLLVVGSRRLGRLGRLVHGSTSHQLARHSHCPLLVVPRPAHETPDLGPETTSA